MSLFASDPDAGLPRLKPNVERIIVAVLYVIGVALDRGKAATKYEIAKAVFIADFRHLETFGRPITYDNYAALPDGPIPSFTLKLLQPDFDWHQVGEVGPLWETQAAPRGGSKAIEYVRPKRAPNLDKLSESDTDALRSALADVQAMGFHRTRDFTHRIPAYSKAWAKRGSANSQMIDYRDLSSDRELIDDLIHTSNHI